jgi:hypothetical protein
MADRDQNRGSAKRRFRGTSEPNAEGNATTLAVANDFRTRGRKLVGRSACASVMLSRRRSLYHLYSLRGPEIVTGNERFLTISRRRRFSAAAQNLHTDQRAKIVSSSENRPRNAPGRDGLSV